MDEESPVESPAETELTPSLAADASGETRNVNGAQLPIRPPTGPGSRGSRKDRPTNAFLPGHRNARTGELLPPRGPDTIPRGSARLMYATILLDKREAIYRNLCKLAEDPKRVLDLLERIADRTEGKPTQKIEASVSRTTVFGPDVTVVEPRPIGEGTGAENPPPTGESAIDRVVAEAIASRTLAGLDVSESEEETP